MESGLGDFMQQLPTGFVLIFCGSGVLLIITLAYMFGVRYRRNQRALTPAMAGAPVSMMMDSDLPDLDMLASSASSKPAPRPAGTYSLQLADGDTVEVVEVLSIVRDVSEGGLIIQIGGKAYRNPPALADAEFKRRFHSTLRDLNSVQRTSDLQPVEPAAQAPVEATSEMPYAPPLSPSMPAPGDLPKFTLPDTPPVKPKRGERPVAAPIPEINIAASIEAFLQHKLSLTPQYANRSIHVRPALHGGVKIEVDGYFYESVGEVEDVAVRQYLAATIEEWQARQ